MNKIAVDFGNSNTVLSLWDENSQKAVLLRLPESVPDGFLIPSLIHYSADERIFIGNDAATQNITDSGTFRWMKRCISLHSPYALRIAGKKINAARAAEDFLNQLLTRAQSYAAFDNDELIFSVPTESFEDYSDWLLRLGQHRGTTHIRLVDEAVAAALGSGLALHPGDLFLIFDFGGSTLQSVCVRITEEANEGHCCRVLAKAGLNLGGSTLDRWIYEEVLKRAEITEGDLRIRPFTASLLKRCETLKIRLSEQDFSELEGFGEGVSFRQIWMREELNQILTRNGLPDRIYELLNEMKKQLSDVGIAIAELRAVLPVGGSCLIPMIRECLTRYFGEKVASTEDPLGAVARGAALYAGGAQIYDTIQHTYALRYRKPDGSYGFHPIVAEKTPFPSSNTLKAIQIKGSFTGQRALGLAIYECGKESSFIAEENELCFEEDGSVRVLPQFVNETVRSNLFWLNEKAPLFLKAEPPAVAGEPCFRLEFFINENRMLLINAIDLRNQTLVLDHAPVVRLN